MGPLLSCDVDNKNEREPGSLQAKLLGVFPQKDLGTFSWEFCQDVSS
jgi:hypothetical protein